MTLSQAQKERISELLLSLDHRWLDDIDELYADDTLTTAKGIISALGTYHLVSNMIQRIINEDR